jgi:hypothetical protein
VVSLLFDGGLAGKYQQKLYITDVRKYNDTDIYAEEAFLFALVYRFPLHLTQYGNLWHRVPRPSSNLSQPLLHLLSS